jgi:hypothetical protein
LKETKIRLALDEVKKALENYRLGLCAALSVIIRKVATRLFSAYS